MKNTTTIVSLFIGLAIFIAGKVYSQPQNETNTIKTNHIDSLEIYSLNEALVQNARHEYKIAYAQVNRKELTPKTKEAKKLERDANKAAKEFRRSVRAKKSVNKNASGQ